MSTWAEHAGLEESETEWPVDRVLELGYLRAIACGVSAIALLLLRQDEPAYSRWRGPLVRWGAGMRKETREA
jgi:hypothetical protein